MKKPRRRSRINEAIKSGEIKLEVPEDNSLEKFIIDQNKALLAGYNPYTGVPVCKAYAVFGSCWDKPFDVRGHRIDSTRQNKWARQIPKINFREIQT